MNELVIDGSNAMLGRLASYVAKQALLGKKIKIVNCNEVVVSGKARSIILEYRETRQRGGASLKGPFFPKQPDRIVKRTIRGMLPYKKGRGAEAFKNIRCYNDIPEELKDVEKVTSGKPKNVKTIKMKDLSKEI